MKKLSIIKLIAVILTLVVCSVLLFACDAPTTSTGNRITSGKDVQTFNYAYIMIDGHEVASGAVTQWRDYEDSDTVQVLLGGKYYLTHYSNVILVADPEKGSLGYDSGWVDHN